MADFRATQALLPLFTSLASPMLSARTEFTLAERAQFRLQLEAVLAEHPESLGLLLSDTGAQTVYSLARCAGHTLLQTAVMMGNKEAVEMLLPHCSLWDLSREGETALTLAAKQGHIEILDRLIELARLSPRIEGDHSVPDHLTRALIAASRIEQIQSIKRLLPWADASKCLPVSLQKEEVPCNALMHAGMNGKTQALRILLAGGGDPNVRNSQGDTALMLAASGGHGSSVRELLAKSDPRARNEEGCTVLMLAATAPIMDRTELLKLLIPHSELEAVDNRGKTALAQGLGGWGYLSEEELKLLFSPGAVARADYRGATPLMLAMKEGSPESVRLLLPHSDPCACDREGRDAMDWAWSAFEEFCKDNLGGGNAPKEGLSYLACADWLTSFLPPQRTQLLAKQWVNALPEGLSEELFWETMPRLQAGVEREALREGLQTSASCPSIRRQKKGEEKPDGKGKGLRKEKKKPVVRL